MNETRITVHGNVVSDPVQRTGRTGSIFTTFRLAHTPYRRGVDGRASLPVAADAFIQEPEARLDELVDCPDQAVVAASQFLVVEPVAGALASDRGIEAVGVEPDILGQR